MRHPEFPAVAFISAALLVLCLPSHIRSRNVSTLSLIFWLGIICLIRGINALLWADNVEIKHLVWCDITTKLFIGITIAVPASALCIMRHLECVASTRHAKITDKDKRRRRIFELIMCFGVPVLFMALHYIVQGHRFDIVEDQGCQPTVYISVASLFIIWLPPLCISFVTFIYAVLTLRHFLRHRIQFAAHLQSQSGINTNRYFRLMALAVCEMTWDIGTNLYIFYVNVRPGLRPWISWENVHSNFSRVQQVPRFLFTNAVLSEFTFDWWIIPVSAITFFMFFGTGQEALSDYCAALNWIRRTVFRQNIPLSKGHGPSSLPSYTSSRQSGAVSLSSPLSNDKDRKPWEDMSIKMPKFSEIEMKIDDDTSSTAPSCDRRSMAAVTTTQLNNVECHLQVPISALADSVQHRGSISTETNISVSEPYSDPRRSSWPVEEDGRPRLPSVPELHPENGVQVTIEKTVSS